MVAYISLLFILLIGGFFIFALLQIFRLNKRIAKSSDYLETYCKKQIKQFMDLSNLCQEEIKSPAIIKFINYIVTTYVSARNPEQTLEAHLKVEMHYPKLFDMLEKYPEFVKSDTFNDWMYEFVKIEEKINFSKQFYNTYIDDYNAYIRDMPQAIVANVLNVKTKRKF